MTILLLYLSHSAAFALGFLICALLCARED